MRRQHPRARARFVRPEGEIRRSQMVGAYGPGALVDLLDHAVLIGGLDFWNLPASAPSIPEPRLREKLMEQLATLEPPVELSISAPFRLPPAGDRDAPSRANGVQALELPEWFVCQRPDCRALLRKHGLTLKRDRWVHECGAGGKAAETVPVRFVAACPLGHIEDFPWRHFVHRGQDQCVAPRLELHEGVSGDFSEIRVTCRACGATAPLSQALIHSLGISCGGHRPWLGADGREACDETLRLLVRTASNGYFAQVVSALSIPDPARELEENVRRVWRTLQAATLETLGAFRTIPEVKSAIGRYTDADVLAVVAALIRGQSAPRLPLRSAEIEQLRAQPVERPGELPPAHETFFARAFVPPGGLPPGIGRLVLAHKLREVRAQVGFTRLEPVAPDLQGELDLGVGIQRLGLATDWLPAAEIRGEGVFLELDEEAVHAWEQREAVLRRDRALQAGFDAWSGGARHGQRLAYPGVRFYLLHSFSHLLIQAISLHCGYPSASIRERIYCGAHTSDQPMAGVLLSTGSAGSEGTLGGLVEEGRRLGEHLRRALDLGSLCANDPVCGGHEPAGDYAERFLEGAACHGCLFIAEPSCERFNRFLDRALVVPTLGQDARLAYFDPAAPRV